MSSEAESVAALAVKAAGAASVIKADNGRMFLLVPEGYEFHDITLDNALDVLKPKTIAQGVTLQNADALVDYVKTFKGGATLLFADVAGSVVVAAIDYHAAGAPDLVKHRATLSLPFSEEWKTWSAIDGKYQQQLEFARFVEENAPDIKAPVAGELLDAVRDLQAHRNVNFVKAVRTETDNESFEYTDNTEARTKGDLELPTKFLLNLPVYFGEAPTEVQAFLRWRLDDAKLSLGIKLHRAELIRQAAFKLIVTGVVERGGAPAIFGKIG